MQNFESADLLLIGIYLQRE